MKQDLIRRLGHAAGAALLSLTFAAAPALAVEAPAKPADAPPATKVAPKKPAADVGSVKGNPHDPNNGFLQRHEKYLKELKAKDGKVDLLLVGDSITDGWHDGGKEVLQKAWGSKMSVFNLGIGGDQTQHVIWRLENGEVEGISPKVAMLMIGTNNLHDYKNEEIVAGITKCVTDLKEKLPKTKVLLLGVFPRNNEDRKAEVGKASDPIRARIKDINTEIAKLDDGGKIIKYLDIGDKFLDKEGGLHKDIMPDFLHPNAKGYQIWVDATQPTLDELMK